MATITKIKRKLVKRSAELWFWRMPNQSMDMARMMVSVCKPESEWDYDYNFCEDEFKSMFGLLNLRSETVRRFRVTIEEIPE